MYRLMLIGFLFAAVSFATAEVRAGGSEECQRYPEGESESSSEVRGKLIVHEWGTFTTFSGSDGVFLDFRPLANEVSDLPSFVLDRANSSGVAVFTKKKLRGRVRMETPVTYFYTDEIRDVEVRVDFPKGLLTEYYPPVKKMMPPFDPKAAYGEGEPLGNSSLDWGTVTLIPIAALAPNIDDDALQGRIAQHLAASAVPADTLGGHYAQARATDSALVMVQGSPSPWPGQQPLYMEKFLFYRGVGQFDLPLRAVFDDKETLKLTNVTDDVISAAIRVDVKGKQIVVSEFGRLEAGASAMAESSQPMNVGDLSGCVVEILVAEGLYEKEAVAMVETWKRSWFTEEGSRVLYIVPPRMTDELLPLTVKPTPDETLRVLVGRMELMSPGLEQQLMDAVRISSKNREQYLKQDEKSRPPFEISPQILELGRMTEPALVRVSKIARDSAVRTEAEQLVAQLRSR